LVSTVSEYRLFIVAWVAGPPSPRISGLARSRHRGDDLGDFVDMPDGVVAPVADVQVAVDIECAAVRLADQTLDGWASVTGIALLASADNGPNLSYLKFHIC
jgi:hypothetical protein